MREIDRLVAAVQARGIDLHAMSPDDFVAMLDLKTVDAMLDPVLADEEQAKFNKFYDLFPDEGPLRRELYPRHMEFFAAGKDYLERLFLAANRIGKTVAGAYEVSCHLTGLYPDWWPGKRFTRPTRGWAAGDTNETTRDIIQLELFGEVVGGDDGRKVMDGSGIVPRAHLTFAPKWKSGVQDMIDTIRVQHVSGGTSILGLKSFDQGRRSFQGTAKDFIWLDEECPIDVYGECMMRIATTRGTLLNTFTPLKGLTEHVLQFLPSMQVGQ
jgi:phage terminase large subunit-like protein